MPGSADESGSSSDNPDESFHRRICARSGFVAACSNFAIQYNYACASIATAVMHSHHGETGSSVKPDFPEPTWAKQYLLSTVFVGSVVGMLTMGYLGDVMGLKRALVLTNSLTVLGALSSALLSWGSPEEVWGVITVSRFVLGAGVGGNYPLSAAKASHAVPVKEAIAKAGAAFFWQGPGSCTPYLFGLVLLRVPPVDKLTSLQFRLLLGAGAIPALVVLYATLQEPMEAVQKKKKEGQLASALKNPSHWHTLVGTAGTWFLFDVAFYGTVIFSPMILQTVFGAQTSLTDLAVRAALMSILGILGTCLGLLLLPVVGAKALNTWGLAVSAGLFAAFAVLYKLHPEQSWELFSFLSLLFFVLYMGPNIATYVLPVVAFPEDVRSTFHGLSAAAAKLGAMTGALLFPVVNDYYGVPTVMVTQAAVCAAGAILNYVAVQEPSAEDEEELISGGDEGDSME